MQKLIVNKVEFKIRFLRKISHLDVEFYKDKELLHREQFSSDTDKKNIIVKLKQIAKDYIKKMPYYLIPDRKIHDKDENTLTPTSFFVRNGSSQDTFICTDAPAKCHAYASYYGKKIKTKMLNIEGQPHTKITIV